VAKLIILRGDALDRRVDLGERTVRIGRADQNDIVLPDPAKAVSRAHAELRFEQGRYVIVDLNSQNGVWADGRRVPQATLEPGVPVVLGSYRLVLEPELPPAPAAIDATVVVSTAGPAPSTAATQVAPLPSAAQPPALPQFEAKPEQILWPPPAQTGPLDREAPRTAPRPDPPPAAKAEPPRFVTMAPPGPASPAVKSTARPAAPVRGAGRRISRGMVLGGLAALFVAAAAATVFLTPLGDRLAELAGRGAVEPSASEPPPAGLPTEAAASPADRPVAPAQPAAVASPLPQAVPARPAARVPADRAPAPPARATRMAVETPPSELRTSPATAGGRRGGTAGEAAGAAEPRQRPANLAQKLDEARSAMNNRDYLAAIAGFEAILAVDPKFPDAADLLSVARGGARNASQLAVEAGNKAETDADYAAAVRHYEQAMQLDPQSAGASDAMRRLRVRMQSEGEKAFKEARQYEAFNRVRDAISMYEKAVQLLPPDHASAKAARERLAALKGGQ
jgi:predicted component of type VI protein secretion system